MSQGFGDWMTEEDLLIDLPGTAWVNNYPFVLLETDKVTHSTSLSSMSISRSTSTTPIVGCLLCDFGGIWMNYDIELLCVCTCVAIFLLLLRVKSQY